MGHNRCDGSQAPGPWAIGSGYRFTTIRELNSAVSSGLVTHSLHRLDDSILFLSIPLG